MSKALKVEVEGVRQFRAAVPRHVEDQDTVFVTRHGHLRGVYLPVNKEIDVSKLPKELRLALLRKTGQELRSHFRKLGVTERQILENFVKWRKRRRAARG